MNLLENLSIDDYQDSGSTQRKYRGNTYRSQSPTGNSFIAADSQ